MKNEETSTQAKNVKKKSNVRKKKIDLDDLKKKLDHKVRSYEYDKDFLII